MSFAWGEHVGELELELRAADEEGILRAAVDALRELLAADDAAVEPGERVERDVRAEGADRPALLAAWLEELLFLAETEGLIPVAVERVELGGDRVSARMSGYPGRPPHLVKAVTYHRLAFAREGEGFRAVAVLDV